MLTIVIPIIRFNHFSRLMMHNLSQIDTIYENLRFLFAVADNSIKEELEGIIVGFTNKYKIYVANSTSSNKLRSYCLKATTPYIYFHDCDDWADYALLNKICSEHNIGDSIYCLNVLKRHYNAEGELCADDIVLFNIPNGDITNICNVPTCIYSKIIPIKYLHAIEFPNLPYTQDWAISYQLYPLAPHIFDNRVSYTYNNYDTSSSHRRHDTPYRVKRVAAYSRVITRKMESIGLRYEADFLRCKYNIDLCYRFRNIGIYIAPSFPTLRTLYKATNRRRASMLYRCLQNTVYYIIKR